MIKSSTYQINNSPHGNIVNEVILEATCDICGEDCMRDDFMSEKNEGDRDETDNIKVFEGMVLKADWGYLSKKDCERWEAVICENCVDKHFKMIQFSKNNYY